MEINIGLEEANSLPEISCIYMLRNKINNKIYIGKTINLKTRIYNHIQRAKYKNSSIPIRNAILKYGISNFSCNVIEAADDNLLEKETYYIDLYNSTNNKIGYNILRIGFDRTGTKHLDETKKKISKSCIKNVKRGVEHYTIKDNNVTNIKKAHLANIGKSRSPEVKKKISDTNKLIDRSYAKISVKQICPKTGNILKIWNSISEANLSFNKSANNAGIRTVCNKTPNGKGCIQKTAHGFVWEH